MYRELVTNLDSCIINSNHSKLARLAVKATTNQIFRIVVPTRSLSTSSSSKTCKMASLTRKNKMRQGVVPVHRIIKMCLTSSISRVKDSSKTKIPQLLRYRLLPLGLTPLLMFTSLTCLAILDSKTHNNKLIYRLWLVITAWIHSLTLWWHSN